MKFFYLMIFLTVAVYGCSSDNDAEAKSEKIENPVDTYMEYNKNVMSKPQEVQQQLDKAMQQRQEQLKQAEESQY